MGSPEDYECNQPVNNYCGDVETWVHQIGDLYLVIVKDSADYSSIEKYSFFNEVSDYMKREFRLWNPEDGWVFCGGKYPNSKVIVSPKLFIL